MPLATRGSSVSVPESHLTVISTSIDVFDEDGRNIGLVQSVTITGNRPVTPVRHLDSVDAGRILEHAPSPEDPPQVALTSFFIYNTGQFRQSLINRLPGASGAGIRNLTSQSDPFDLVVSWRHPSTGVQDSLVAAETILTSWELPFSLDQALIAERASGQCIALE